MEGFLIELFEKNIYWAIPLSLLINTLIAIAGLIPTYFITGANVALFGPVWGGVLSAGGEALGAVVSFWIYRKGFKKVSDKKLNNYPKVKKILDAGNKDAAVLVFAFRLVPYVPSGIITFAAAMGKISLPVFAVSSTIGKIPALFIEVVSVYYVLKLPLPWILTAVFLIITIPFLFGKIQAWRKAKKTQDQSLSKKSK